MTVSVRIASHLVGTQYFYLVILYILNKTLAKVLFMETEDAKQHGRDMKGPA